MATALAHKRVDVLATDVEGLRDYAERLRNGQWLPMGSVEYVQAAMHVAGIQPPEFNCYPRTLLAYLSARPWRTTLERALARSEATFVKPMRVKAFDGFVYRPEGFDQRTDEARLRDRGDCDAAPAARARAGEYAERLAAARSLAADTPVWCAEPREFVSEWRYYLLGGQLVGYARYDDGPEQAPAPSTEDVASMMADMAAGATCSLDIGVGSEGGTWLVEVNDAWALGYYRGPAAPPPHAYLCMLWTRWQQLLAAR